MIERLAHFCGAPLDKAAIALVEKMTSRDFMYAHKGRFEDALMCQIFEQKLGIPADSDSTKVQVKASNANQVPQPSPNGSMPSGPTGLRQ